MGIYLNPGNEGYQVLLNSQVVVDKSLLIEKTNFLLNTTSSFICVSRPRRFGKSTDANMLVAYYSKGCDSHCLFDDLKISKTKDYRKQLNQHNVIHLNMQRFLSRTSSIREMLEYLTEEVIEDINEVYVMKSKKTICLNFLKKCIPNIKLNLFL